MILLGSAIWVYRSGFRRLDLVFLLGLAYVADATVTSFLVSSSVGIGRTIQFLIIALALGGLYAFAQTAKRADGEAILKAVGILCAIVLAHLIIWHVLHHHPVTWKYLSDTKLILSVSLIPFFGLEDRIKARGSYVFPIALLAIFAIILLSGERKALMLFCALFALSRFSLAAKFWLVAAIAAVAGIALMTDGGYIHRQLLSVSHDYSQTPTRYFFSVQSIYDQSDIIREFVNRNAWHLFRQHSPLGLGATGYWAWAMETYGKSNGLAMNVHGEMDRVPVEGGVVGIVIAVTFLGLALWRAVRHIANNGGLNAAAPDRAPLYCVVLLLCYCYSEAVDTAMLVIIGGVGVIVGNLPLPVRSLRSGARRFGRIGHRPRLAQRVPVPAGSWRRKFA